MPQYPTTYNDDTVPHGEPTPATTESLQTPYIEPALPGRYSASDDNTTNELVCAIH